MNLTNSFFASLSMALTIVAAGAGTTSPSEPLAGGRLFGLWQTNGVLFKEAQPYRGVGANYFDLFLRVPHEPANRTSIDGLERLGRAGIPFVRFAVAFDDTDWKVLLDQPEEFFRRLDSVVRAAERANVGLIPSFFWGFMSFPDLTSEPRDQWGNPDSKKSWKADSKEQTLEILRRDNPAPLDTIAIHLYADQPVRKETAAWAKDHAEYLLAVRQLSREMKRPVFVGEFGLASPGATGDTKAEFERLLADLDQGQVDLAAFWVFDLASQSQDWSVTFENARAYMIKLTAEANRRWNRAAMHEQP